MAARATIDAVTATATTAWLGPFVDGPDWLITTIVTRPSTIEGVLPDQRRTQEGDAQSDAGDQGL